MSKSRYSIITGSGKFRPERIVRNADFLNHEFYDNDGNRIDKSNEEIVKQFEEITGIRERRYAEDDMVNSDMAYIAAKEALDSSGIDKETIDYIILAHNFGDVRFGTTKTDMVPALASRVKHKLGIENPYCIPYDLPFGCPGWVQGMIQADCFIKAGEANRVLVIGAEMMSRVVNVHDRDSMIFSDGAGATILEGIESDEPVGMLSHKTRSDTLKEAFYLYMEQGPTNDEDPELYIKMLGRKVYEYALVNVPQTVKESIDGAGLDIKNINKVLIHQANAKMDEAILGRVFRLYDIKEVPEGIMPMTIGEYGNNSVATIPIMYDKMLKGEFEDQTLQSGDNIVFTSVGAGMNINSAVYRVA